MGGGLGHGVRALALARNLGGPCVVWAPGRLRPFAAWAGVACESPADEPRPDREGLGDWVAERLATFRPDLLVVDVFPRGVLGEIPPGGPPRILTVRQVDPAFYAAPGPARALAECRGFLAAEPPPPALADDARLRRVGPITLVAPGDLKPRDEARSLLGASGEEPLVLVLGTGPREEQERLVQALRGFPAQVLVASRLLPGALDLAPAGPWLRGADAVVAAAGYAAWHEVAMSGVPAVFVPQARPLDDQARRASGALGALPSGPWRTVATAAEVPGALRQVLREPPGPVQGWTGAQEGARLLRAW